MNADIERMAREAGAQYELGAGDEPTIGGLMFWEHNEGYPALARFAALVLEEAARVCADVAGACDDWDEGRTDGRIAAGMCADAIRALATQAQRETP